MGRKNIVLIIKFKIKYLIRITLSVILQKTINMSKI